MATRTDHRRFALAAALGVLWIFPASPSSAQSWLDGRERPGVSAKTLEALRNIPQDSKAFGIASQELRPHYLEVTHPLVRSVLGEKWKASGFPARGRKYKNNRIVPGADYWAFPEFWYTGKWIDKPEVGSRRKELSIRANINFKAGRIEGYEKLMRVGRAKSKYQYDVRPIKFHGMRAVHGTRAGGKDQYIIWQRGDHYVHIRMSLAAGQPDPRPLAEKIHAAAVNSGWYDFPRSLIESNTKVTLLDANPQYYGSGKTLPDQLKTIDLINGKTKREGTTADGVSRLVIRAELTSDERVEFSVGTGENGTVEPLFGGKTLYHEKKHYAFALYTPPTVFTPDTSPPAATFAPTHSPGKRLGGILEYRDIDVEITGKRSDQKTTHKLKLARPPVVLVHGLGSNPHECWVVTKPAGTSMVALLEKAGFLPFTVSYQRTNGLPGSHVGSSFAANSKAVWNRTDPFKLEFPSSWEIGEGELPIVSLYQRAKPDRIGGIKHALEHYRGKLGIAATQADVVGHSMGGLLSRCYASETYNPDYRRPENFNEGDINRLITLNTPHHGSELAHVYDALTKAWVGGESWSKWMLRMPPSLAGSFVGVKTPAIRDLTAPLTSEDVQASALGRIGTTPIPAFAIATTVDHNQLGSREFDHALKYRHLYGTIGMAFFHNRPLLNDFVSTRFGQWQSAPDPLRLGAINPTGKTITPEHPETVESYTRIINTNIDANAAFWFKRRDKKHREALIKYLENTTVLPFGTIDNDRSETVTPGLFGEYERSAGRASRLLIGGDITKLKNPDSDQDVPSSTVGLIRSLIFHNDPKNDGAVRVVSQLGSLPESSTTTFGDQDGGIIHSYSPWHFRVQREVIHLLKWQNARFNPAGFPPAGQLTSRHLPSTDLSRDSTRGDHAIEWAGIVPSHAQAYAEVADKHAAVILVRPVNRDSTALIKEGNATKAMAVKGKSSNWGPQKGFIPVQQRFSKLWQVHKKNPSVRADKITEYDAITQKVLKEPHPFNKGRKYVKPASLVKDGYEVLALPADKEPDAEKAIVMRKGGSHHDWKRQPRSLTDAQIQSLRPLEVLAVDQDGPVKYVTADYDLLAIGRHDPSIVSNPGSFRHGPPAAVTGAPFHELMGFVSPAQIKIIDDLNGFVKNTGYDGGYVTHHGPEVQYNKSPYVDYPILVCDPGDPKVKGDQSVFIIHQGPAGFRDIHLKRYFTEQIKKGYRLWPNPDSRGWLWEHYRKFDIETGYDPTDSPDLLPYVAEQTDPRKEGSAPDTAARKSDAPREKESDEMLQQPGPREREPAGNNDSEVAQAPRETRKYAGTGTKRIRDLANRGDTSAMKEMALRYSTGNGTTKDRALALQWLTMAAERGDKTAPLHIARHYISKDNPYPDPVQALYWYRKAARQGRAEAHTGIGYMHARGIGMPRNHKLAIKHYRKAAAMGDSYALNNLGKIYIEGKHVTKDPDKAVACFEQAAKLGNQYAHRNLAYLHQNGIGRQKNLPKAAEWYAKSARLGDTTAANLLGILYEKGGDGLEKDHAKALDYFRQAARGGNMYAQRNVGAYTMVGQGTARNLPEAYAWLHLAANNGFRRAGKERDALEKHMTASQVRTALKRYNQLAGEVHDRSRTP